MTDSVSQAWTQPKTRKPSSSIFRIKFHKSRHCVIIQNVITVVYGIGRIYPPYRVLGRRVPPVSFVKSVVGNGVEKGNAVGGVGNIRMPARVSHYGSFNYRPTHAVA